MDQSAALEGKLHDVEFVTDPVFGLSVPTSCPDVPTEVLIPKKTWADRSAYDAKASHLAQSFKDEFKKFQDVPKAVLAAGPK